MSELSEWAEGILACLCVLLQVNTLKARLNDMQPQVIDSLESLVDPKILAADRSKLHMLLLNSKG